MKKDDWNLLDNITFKTQGYRRNFDLINNNENFITEYDGVVSEIRIQDKKPPIVVGEYGFSVWNIELGNKFGVDFYDLLKKHAFEDTYDEFLNMVEKNEININKHKKIVLVHTFVLREDYRKRGITEELIEMIYRDFYCDDDIPIIMLVKPFQNNVIDVDYYLNIKKIIIREKLQSAESKIMSAAKYYSLDKFIIDDDDDELNEYKLFAVANRCGFERIDNSYLFKFKPEKIEKRMIKKQEYSQQLENE